MRTKAEYMPYIRIIKRDLKIPATFRLRITFETSKQMNGLGGQVIHWVGTRRPLDVRINAEMSHARTIEVLMHEFMHVAQRYFKRLVSVGNERVMWHGVEMDTINTNDADISGSDAYYNLPWEIEARAYEDQRLRLFPYDRRLGKTRSGVRFTILSKIGDWK